MYQCPNTFQGMTVVSSDVFKHIVESQWPYNNHGDSLQVHAPDGHLFTVENSASEGSKSVMQLHIIMKQCD